MDPVERFRTAQRLLAAGDPQSSMQVLEPLLDGEADNLGVLLLAARACFDSAQLDRAEALFRRLIELDPCDHYARAGLGRTLQRRSRHREAVTHLRVATALDPQPWYQEALQRSESVVAAEPPPAGTPPQPPG